MKYDVELKELREKIARKASLEAKRRELEAQRENLAGRVQELKSILRKEQGDVERLEHTSLSGLFYAAIGKKEERLDKEKLEACAAKAKYDAAARELNFTEEDIRCVEAQLCEIAECEDRYAALLQEKMAEIKASGAAEAERILRWEEQIAAQERQKKEIGEAIAAGTRALDTVENILSNLNSAQSWGTWDLLGGGLLSDIAKHSRLDDAQKMVQQLQEELRQFKTELADITIQTDIQVSVDGFMRFADYFFDGLFADWVVLDKINESLASVQRTKNQIEEVLSNLRGMEDTAARELAALEAEKEAAVVTAAL